MYNVTLIVDSLLGKRDTIAPILEDEHTRIYGCSTSSWYVGKIVNGLVDTCVSIQILTILHTNALKIVLKAIALEMLRTIESQVLQEVSQTTLVVVLINRTNLLCNVETCYMLREIVVTNVVGKAVVKVTDSHILVNRNLRHLLCHH